MVNFTRRSTQIWTVLVAALAGALFATSFASASFTRPFLREITRTENPSGLGCTQAQAMSAPCLATTGAIAVDGKDNVWVGDANSGGLDEFSPAYSTTEPSAFQQIVPMAPSTSMAIAGATGDFYVDRKLQAESLEVFSPTGAHLETSEFDDPAIAVDNSTEPLSDPSACTLSECTVYVFDKRFEQSNKFAPNGIHKLSSKGMPVEFTDTKKCASEGCGYIEGNEILGTPASVKCKDDVSFFEDHIIALAVDPDGDIYAASEACSRVFEFKPSGEYIRDFQVNGGGLRGIAFDPVSERLLVSVERNAGIADLSVVEEFDPATGQLLTQTTETAEGTSLPAIGEIAVDSKGDLYAVKGGVHTPTGERDAVYVWAPGRFLPSVTLGPATERRGESALLNGSVNPEGLQLGKCEFQYVSEQAFESEGFSKPEVGECAPAASTIPSETKEDAVEAEIQGLTPGATYRYRLLATSEGAQGGSSHTQPLEFTAPSPPEILSSSAANLSSTFADLHAQLAPRGAATSYRFEYLSAAAYTADGESWAGPDPATSIPVPDGSIGLGGPAGDAVESVVQHIGPLAPGATYYYRVVANNSQGTVSGGGVCEGGSTPSSYCTFATLPATVPGLADGRSYELVTPATKEGGSDMFAHPEVNGEFFNVEDVGTASESGNGFLLETYSPFGPFPGSGRSAYVFSRNAQKGEWTYVSLASPTLGPQTVNRTVFDPADFSRVGVNALAGAEYNEQGAHYKNLVGPPGGPYTTLFTGALFHSQVGVTTEKLETSWIVGASRDMSHVLLESYTNEGHGSNGCPEAGSIKSGRVLCEWGGGYETLPNGEVTPKLALVSVDDEGSPVSTCGAVLGGGGGTGEGSTSGAVSADGSRVFFIAPDPNEFQVGPGCFKGGRTNAPQLYVRVKGRSTLEVSEPEPGVREPGSPRSGEVPVRYPAIFAGASEDGSKVFFLTETWLTANHPSGHDLELYECEVTEEVVEDRPVPMCKLTRISSGETGSSTGAVYAAAAISPDGSSVYFLANEVLAANVGANGSHAAPGGCGAGESGLEEGGTCGLYRYDTATGVTTYIATINSLAFSSFGSKIPYSAADWYTTPDGRYLLFKSNRPLTGFSNAGSKCFIEVSGGDNHGPCAELYRYDANAAAEGRQPIVCVSCGEGGLPTGNARFSRSAVGNPTSTAIRAMSNNGEYVFFDTPTPLLPQATNGSLDVYEWHEDAASHESTISLMGSGSEPGPSYLLGSSVYTTPAGETIEGGNVFIGTHAKLVAADTNSVGNIYDVRVCVAESPCIKAPPGETAQCEGSSCESPSVEPNDATPTSLTFAGPGDVFKEVQPFGGAKTVTKKKVPAKCKKGYVKKKGKCVRQRKRKAKAKKTSDKRRAKS